MKKTRIGQHSPAQLLVTTALEETWCIDKPIVFLGEWCRLYDRKLIWEKCQHSVIRNHWDDRRKLAGDHDYLKVLHTSLLEDLLRLFNGYHHIKRPLRYWQMILDPWLLTYVAVIWDRWECLRLAFEEHELLETIELASSVEVEPCFDYNDFIGKALGDAWNYRLFLEIMASNYSEQCTIRRLGADLASASNLNGFASELPPRSINYRLAEIVDGLFTKLSVRNRVVIFNSYFPPAAFVRLNLSLGQLPRLYLNEFQWPMPLVGSNAFDGRVLCREGISLGLEPKNPFERFLFDRIVRDIPFVYLEGFSTVRARARRVSMKPKAILTANAHWGNELFKLWSAEQVLDGVKLVTMEHGGCIPPTLNAMSFEEDIADIRTTWVKPYHRKHRRMPPNKLAAIKIRSSKERLAVVGVEMPRYNFRAEAAPKSGQVLTSYDMVCRMYCLLTEDIKLNVRVKPYPERGWNIRQRFIDALGAEKVSDERNYYRFLSCARVIVCTYPQTTFSEAMASGLPSMLLYPAHLWETIPEMDPLLEILRTAKILFHDPQSAATHINSIWDDPDQWWNSSPVVHSRNEFYRQALDINGNWLKKWVSCIREFTA